MRCTKFFPHTPGPTIYILVISCAIILAGCGGSGEGSGRVAPDDDLERSIPEADPEAAEAARLAAEQAAILEAEQALIEVEAQSAIDAFGVYDHQYVHFGMWWVGEAPAPRPWLTSPTHGEPVAPAADRLVAVDGSTELGWIGQFRGMTPERQHIAGSVDLHLQLDLDTWNGKLSITGLHLWVTPGLTSPGTWGDGDLEYVVAVNQNRFFRTDGDDGEIDGRFYGPNHEEAAGYLRRDDLTGVFGTAQR